MYGYILLYKNYNQRTMIGAGRKINDFDTFMAHNQLKGTSPRPLQPNYHSNNHQERHLSPNRISANHKPMISPSRSPRNPPPRTKIETENKEFTCCNESHPNKKAQYVIHIEDQDMYYCGVCATQAASQGFTVIRIPNKRQRTLPHHPEYHTSKRYQQLTELLKGIISLQNQYKKVQPLRVTQHYQQQEELLNSFYDELGILVQKMKNDHLADLRVEQEKNCQTATLGQDNLRLHMQELSQVWQDIEANLQQVVQEVDQPSYENCMNTYRNSLHIFSHKLEQYNQDAQQFTTYSQPLLQRKVTLFEQQLIDLWNEETNHHQPGKVIQGKRPNHSDRTTTIKNVHEMLPKSTGNHHNEGPFRNLFPQDSEQRHPQTSPQFKAF